MQPLTLNGPVPFGYHRDGSPAAAEMRERCVVVVGEQGSGKTNMMHNFIAGLVRCPDCLVWPIDLGGLLVQPWLGPFLDGDTAVPALDWVAIEVDEALLLTEMALQIIDMRRRVFRAMLKRQDRDKLRVTPEFPAIYIPVDEGKMALGLGAHPQLQANLIQIADTGRSMAVRVLISSLRATADALPMPLMTGMGIRVMMNAASEAEFGHLLGWRMRVNPRDFQYPGCGIWRDGMAGTPRPFRSYDLTRPSRIAAIAEGCEQWRPQLDEVSLRVPLAVHYGDRWGRAAVHLGVDPVQPGSALPPAHRSAQGSAPSAPPGVHGGVHTPGGAVDLSLLDAKIAQARRLRAQEQLARVPAEAWDAEFARIADSLDDDRAAGGWQDSADEAPTDAAADWQTRAAELLDAAGADGVSGPRLGTALADEGFDVSQATLYRWLRQNAVKGGYGAWQRKVGP